MKFKFVVGEPEGQSEIWTIVINGNDVYVTSSGAKVTKLSLHESGQINWSVLPDRLESLEISRERRHLAHWLRPVIPMGHLNAWFYLLFPVTELRPGRPCAGDAAIRIPAPGPMQSVRIIFASTAEPLAGPIESYPLKVEAPLTLLFAHLLKDGRLFTAVTLQEELHPGLVERMAAARDAARQILIERGQDPTGARAGGVVHDRWGIPGFIDVAPHTDRRGRRQRLQQRE